MVRTEDYESGRSLCHQVGKPVNLNILLTTHLQDPPAKIRTLNNETISTHIKHSQQHSQRNLSS